MLGASWQAATPSSTCGPPFVFGSVARGDFTRSSHVDLLIVCGALPPDPLARLRVLGNPDARIEPVARTLEEWRRQRGRRNSIAIEAAERGVWIVGQVEDAEP